MTAQIRGRWTVNITLFDPVIYTKFVPLGHMGRRALLPPVSPVPPELPEPPEPPVLPPLSYDAGIIIDFCHSHGHGTH